MNSPQILQTSQSKFVNGKSQHMFSSPRSMYFDNQPLKKSMNSYIIASPSHLQTPSHSQLLNSSQSYLNQPSPQKQQQFSILSAKMNSSQPSQSQVYYSKPNSPNIQRAHVDFSTYAHHKQMQLKLQIKSQKTQSVTSSPMYSNINPTQFKKQNGNSQFAPCPTSQQRKLERFIQKGQRSLTHFMIKNKDTLNEKNIVIPNILSQPQKINYLFNDLHLMSSQHKQSNDNYMEDFKLNQPQSQSQNINFMRNRTQQIEGRNKFYNASTSLPSLSENLINSQPSIRSKKNVNEQSPVQRIFDTKKSIKLQSNTPQNVDYPNFQDSPNMKTPSKNGNIIVKIQPTTSSFQLQQDQIENREYQDNDDKSYFNRKKISWSDQLFVQIKKQKDQSSEDEQQQNDVEQFSPFIQSSQQTLNYLNDSPILQRHSQSLLSLEKISPTKLNEEVITSKSNEKKAHFKEQIRKQMSMLPKDPNETVIDRNFKKFKIIQDLQKLRIQDKLNQFKISDTVDQKQILKRNASKLLIPSQTTTSSGSNTLSNIQNVNSLNQISNNNNQICPTINIAEQNVISPEELEQTTQYGDIQNNFQSSQMQAPPSLQNIEYGASSYAINETNIIPSIESIEKNNTFTGFLKNSLNINLQGMSQQNLDDEIETPLISYTNQHMNLQRMKTNSIDHKQNNLLNSPDLGKLTASPSTQTSQLELLNLNSFSQLEPKMMLRKQVTLKLKSIQGQDIGDSQMSEIENLVKNHTNDNSFCTNSPRSPYTRKQYKQSIRKSAFTSNLNTPKSGRTNTRIMTFNAKINSNEHIALLDGFWSEDEIKILHELGFVCADLVKALQQDISSQLKNDICYFCTQDFDQFIFSISQFIQYICTDTQQKRNDHYIFPFKLNPNLIQQILFVFIQKLYSLNLEEKAIDIFRNAFNKHSHLILATTIQEKLGGELQKQRIISEIIDYQIQNSTNSIFERFQKDELIQSQLKTINLILKSSNEEVTQQEWKEVKYYNAVDIFESKKAFLSVMSRYRNFYDENFCYEFIQQIERCRDDLTHSLSIHRYEKDLKFIKSLREYLAKIQFIQKLGQQEREIIINTIIQYFFSPNITSQQFISTFQQNIVPITAQYLKEVKEILINHLRIEQEYNENPEYGLQFEYKLEKINWSIHGNPMVSLGDLTSFIEQFNLWVDSQITQKKNLKGFEPYEVKSTENFEAIIKFYYNQNEVFHIKDVQFSLSLPIFDPEPLLKFWLKGIKHTIMSHCGLEKEEATRLRDQISQVMIKQGGPLKSIRKQNTQNSIKNANSTNSN